MDAGWMGLDWTGWDGEDAAGPDQDEVKVYGTQTVVFPLFFQCFRGLGVPG